MELEGTINKSGNIWLIEIPSLDLMTQGRTKKEALSMIVDATMGLTECYFDLSDEDDFTIQAEEYEKGIIGLSASNTTFLLALSLKRQREKSGLTLREVANRLGSSSPNAYAQYEKGKTRMSLEKFDALLKAVDPIRRSLLRIV